MSRHRAQRHCIEWSLETSRLRQEAPTLWRSTLPCPLRWSTFHLLTTQQSFGMPLGSPKICVPWPVYGGTLLILRKLSVKQALLRRVADSSPLQHVNMFTYIHAIQKELTACFPRVVHPCVYLWMCVQKLHLRAIYI